jgi:hypothetical protein
MQDERKKERSQSRRDPFRGLDVSVDPLRECPGRSHRELNGPWKIRCDGYPLAFEYEPYFAGYSGDENSGT